MIAFFPRSFIKCKNYNCPIVGDHAGYEVEVNPPYYIHSQLAHIMNNMYTLLHISMLTYRQATHQELILTEFALAVGRNDL